MIALILVAHLARAAEPRKIAYFFGGGGEPPGESTIFDPATKAIAQKLREGHYQTTVAYDGGHAKSEALAKEAFGQSTLDAFTADDMANKLEDLRARLGKDIPRGSKVLLVVNSHGGPPPDEESSHEVFDSQQRPINLANLKKVVAAAEANGVKLAIVDASCYSGASLELATEKTCVITAASKSTLGFSGYLGALADGLTPGSSLEDAFLRGRARDPEGYPQISTDAGLRTYAQLRALDTFGSALFRHDSGLSGFGPDGKPLLPPSTVTKACFTVANIGAQMPFLLQILRWNHHLSPGVLHELRSAAEGYQWTLNQAMADRDYMNTMAEIGGVRTTPFTLMDIDAYLSNLRRMIDAPGVPDHLREAWRKQLTREPELRAAAAELAKDERVQRVRQKMKGEGARPDIDPQVMAAAYRLSRAERFAYPQVYDSFRGEKKEACRDFTF